MHYGFAGAFLVDENARCSLFHHRASALTDEARAQNQTFRKQRAIDNRPYGVAGYKADRCG